MTIATNSDIQTLSDAELAILLDDILNEQERRAALANTASQVEMLSVRYIGIGGDPEALTAALGRAKDTADSQSTTPAEESPVE
jgi:hypothetical protein